MTEQTERLLQHAEFLDALPDEQFNIDSWVSRTGGHLMASGHSYVGCGTVACAMGWAPAVFPELKYHSRGFVLNGEYIGGFSAAVELFGIDSGEASYLFDGDQYPSGRMTRPSEVSTRIYRLVSTRETSHAP